MKPKRTPGGSTVLSYEDVKPRRGLPAHVDADWRDALQAHYDRHLGAEGKIFHELVSETVHLDLSVHAPSAERPFYTVATMGVSDAELNVPAGAEEFRHIELIAYLPDGWNVDFQSGEDESWWPGRLLRQLGRFVHDYNTFFAPGHTIPNPDGPYAPGSVLETALLVPPFLDGDEFHTLSFGGKTCRFLAVWPITSAECQLKLERGTSDLLDVLEKAGVSPIVDPWRSCSVTRRRPPARTNAAVRPDRREDGAPGNDEGEGLLPAPAPRAAPASTETTEAATRGADEVMEKLAAAEVLLAGKRYRECVDALRRIGADHPERWGDCLARMGAAYFLLGEYDKAVACYAEAMKNGADERKMRDRIEEARRAQAATR